MNVIAKLFGTLIKAVLALLILALLAPILYFAWRANQPMDMPEFKGLTLVQYEDWLRMTYEKSENEFALAHPDRTVEKGACFKENVRHQVGTVAIDILALSSGVLLAMPNTSARERLVSEINRFGGLRAVVWRTIENALSFVASFLVVAPSREGPWCDIRLSVPTPEQYEAMKQEANMTP